jgi:hypothetical protein
MANPTTNYGWPMPTSTDLVTDLPADFDAFGQPVDTTLKALNPETTLGDISYRSATPNTNTRLGIGTDGQVLAVSGGVPAWTTTADVTPLTTKGDLFTFTTVDARLGVGADGTVLTAASGEATGLEWAAPAGGGGMTLLSTTSLTGASVTISTISQDYNTLVFDLEDVVPATDDVNLNIRLNGQTGSVYTELRSMDSSSGASAVATSLKIITAAGNNANDFCNVRLSIPNYTCAFYKYALVQLVFMEIKIVMPLHLITAQLEQ